MKTNNNLLATSAGEVRRVIEFTSEELYEIKDAVAFWREIRKQRKQTYLDWGKPTAAKLVAGSIKRCKSILAKLEAGL